MAQECTILEYLSTKQTLILKIQGIEAIILAMTDALLLSTQGAKINVSEYSLDDGQMKIKTIYKSSSDVSEGILKLEQLKQIYVNRLNGRVFNLRDRRGLI